MMNIKDLHTTEKPVSPIGMGLIPHLWGMCVFPKPFDAVFVKPSS
jgi:hypothetical protein